MQQSAVASARGLKSLQLSFPQMRDPAQSESLSQSPSFSWQGDEELQQSQSDEVPPQVAKLKIHGLYDLKEV